MPQLPPGNCVVLGTTKHVQQISKHPLGYSATPSFFFAARILDGHRLIYPLGRDHDQTRAPFYPHVVMLMRMKICLLISALSDQVGGMKIPDGSSLHNDFIFLPIWFTIPQPFKHLSHEDGWLTCGAWSCTWTTCILDVKDHRSDDSNCNRTSEETVQKIQSV